MKPLLALLIVLGVSNISLFYKTWSYYASEPYAVLYPVGYTKYVGVTWSGSSGDVDTDRALHIGAVCPPVNSRADEGCSPYPLVGKHRADK
jgi:hypothetical protein